MAEKIDNIEKSKRIRIIQEWIIDDFPYTDIVQNIMNKWNLSERHAKRYIASARDKWNDEEDKLIDRKRNIKIQSLKKLKRSLQEKYKGSPSGIFAIVAIEKELIKLEGLEPAKKLEHSGPKGGPIPTETTHKVIFENYAE